MPTLTFRKYGRFKQKLERFSKLRTTSMAREVAKFGCRNGQKQEASLLNRKGQHIRLIFDVVGHKFYDMKLIWIEFKFVDGQFMSDNLKKINLLFTKVKKKQNQI